MLWRLTLAVAVVCVGGMCSCVEADLMSRLMLPRDYGVKLCGREFIRAVIFTCGGSRWKRSTEAHTDPDQWRPVGDVTEEDPGDSRQHAASPPRLPPPLSLADIVALRGVFGDWQQLLREPEEPEETRQWQVLGEQDKLRMKRNFSLGVAGMCCKQGCTKNDIGRLC